MEADDASRERGRGGDVSRGRAAVQHPHDRGPVGSRRRGEARAQQRDLLRGALELGTHGKVEQHQRVGPRQDRRTHRGVGCSRGGGRQFGSPAAAGSGTPAGRAPPVR